MTLTRVIDGVQTELTSEEEAELLAAWAAKDELKKQTAYLDLRRNDYPSIGDQLDLLYKAMDTGEIPKALEFFNALKEIKDRYPKPSGGG